MSERRTVTRGLLEPAEVAAVLKVVAAAAEEDGVRPLSEHAMLHLRYGGDPRARNVLLYHADELAGYGHLDPTDPVEGPSGELVIDPSRRGRGHGTALVRALLQIAGGRLRLWAHGQHPAAERLAVGMGFERVRSLWQMRRSLDTVLPPAELPDGITLRTFQVGVDEAEWVALNAAAFTNHPEQGAWTLDDLRRREAEPWFDPAGFFLAERGGKLVGFHWTKVHGGDGGGAAGRSAGGSPADGHGHEPLGEVYVVGVHPAERGTGLGRALTLVGLQHLRARGLSKVMLYVDEANTPAIRLYESLGFTHWGTDVMYRR